MSQPTVNTLMIHLLLSKVDKSRQPPPNAEPPLLGSFTNPFTALNSSGELHTILHILDLIQKYYLPCINPIDKVKAIIYIVQEIGQK